MNKTLTLRSADKPLLSPATAERMTEATMDELIQTYGNSLLRLCTLYLKDRHLAEDAVQDVYIKVWKNFSSYRGDANLKTWITSITINICKNYLRNPWHRRMQAHDLGELLDETKDNYQQIERHIDLIEEILKLKEKYRIVILLYYYQELSIKEIASLLHKNEATISSLLRRGRKQLKAVISEEDLLWI